MHAHKLATAAFVLAVGWALGTAPASAIASDADAPATLSVTGQGTISRAPDQATVDVSIVTNDDSAAKALSENNTRFAALGAKLAAHGITANDISSASITSYFAPHPPQPNQNTGQLYGYVFSRQVRIAVHALATTGAVVDAATAAGATNIDGVSYGFRDQHGVQREALAAAVADAMDQAQTLAAAAHVHIVRVAAINHTGGAGGFVPIRRKVMASVALPSVPTVLEPGDVDVASSVTITYIIR